MRNESMPRARLTCRICGRHQDLPPDGPDFVKQIAVVMAGWIGVWQGLFCPDHRHLAPKDEEDCP